MDIARCAYVSEQDASALHRYRFASSCSMFMPRCCERESLMSLNSQELSKLGEYPKGLAVSIVKWFSTQKP